MDNLPSKMEKWFTNILLLLGFRFIRKIPDNINIELSPCFISGNLPNKAFNRETYEIDAGINASKPFIKRLHQMYDMVVIAWKTPNQKNTNTP